MHLKYISSTRIFLFQIYQDFSSFLCLCIYRFLYRKNRIAQHCQTDCCFCPKFQLGTQFSGRRQTSCWKCNDRRIGSVQCLFAEDTEEKKIYLTFDAGFENGNTPAILDALKKHQAPATFFVVGNFISENKDLIKRMETEGHIVGNHTMTHPDMSKISTKESFQKELSDVEKFTGKLQERNDKILPPPQGIYSTQNLSMARELGYHTFFWSLAYVDWYQDNQPDPQEAIAKLTKRIHPGAIVLLHSTSSTNAQILDELLDKWEAMGYSFHSLNEL